VARFEGVRFSSVAGSSAVSVSGNRLPYTPETLLTAALGYAHPRGWNLQVEAVHVSEQYADDLNSVAPSADGQRGLLPASTIWNATVGYEIKALKTSVFLAAKNLLDELYVVDRSRGLLPGPTRLFQVGLVTRLP
jgi:Fe(3+) dicitrate transport protein